VAEDKVSWKGGTMESRQRVKGEGERERDRERERTFVQ